MNVDTTRSADTNIPIMDIPSNVNNDPYYTYLAKLLESNPDFQELPRVEIHLENVFLEMQRPVAMKEDHTELPHLYNVTKRQILGLCNKQPIVTKPILTNITATFTPGTTTLVLGRSGSGKTSLLKVISGRIKTNARVNMHGQINYNGVPAHKLASRLPQVVAFVDQRDDHFPLLTVKETLEFAFACSGKAIPDRYIDNKDPTELLDEVQKVYSQLPHLALEQYGLLNCQNTVVGNVMVRGVSGGEKRRVTSAELEAFGVKSVTVMDEISTGLDSASTYDVVLFQTKLARELEKTVVISLLQPPPEVYNLFTNIILLIDGCIAYNGRRESVTTYFDSIGLTCPTNRDVADFLVDLGTNKQMQYHQIHPTNPMEAKTPFRAKEYAIAHTRSPQYIQIMNEIMNHSFDAPNEERTFNKIPKFSQSFAASTMQLIKRQWTIAKRNTAFLKARVMVIIIMSFLYSTVFYQLDRTRPQLVLGVIFFSILFISLGQVSQIAPTIGNRVLFYKQRDAQFFRTGSYVLATSITEVPYVLVETCIYSPAIYFLTGLNSAVVNFVIFAAMLFTLNMTFYCWFQFVAASSADTNIGKARGSVSVMMMMLFAGFIVARDHIPNYLIWVHWLTPFSWALRALAINEYHSSQYNLFTFNNVSYLERYNTTMGNALLESFAILPNNYWIPLGFGYCFLFGTVFLSLTCYNLEYKRFDQEQNDRVEVKKDFVLKSEPQGQYQNTYQLYQDSQLSPTSVTQNSNNSVVIHVGSGNMLQVEPIFQPVTIAFRDIHYSVPSLSAPNRTIELLKGVTGYAKPSTMTALMGSSGAGKTTLMDVIAGRKTGGSMTGEILLNGFPATVIAIKRCTGYCEQTDIHSETATIREALTFSAFLRQSSAVSNISKHASVEESLRLLELHSIADQMIRGMSKEQKKRVTIGVELAAQPSILFLDEPTSGLDSRSAKVIMEGILKIASTGRTILCTIHQPSYEVFKMFDNLLLLKRGGETVYFGPLGEECQSLIQYFQSIPNVTDLKVDHNPATWMLEVIGAGINSGAQDTTASIIDETNFNDLFTQSQLHTQMIRNLNQPGVLTPQPNTSPISYKQKRAASNYTQCRFLLSRFMLMYWRTASYNMTRIYISMFLSVLFGLLFFKAEFQTFRGVNSGLGMLFTSTVFQGVGSLAMVLPLSMQERQSYYRERATETYNTFWYVLGSSLAEVPFIICQTLVFVAVFYPMVGFTDFGNLVLYWWVLSLYILMQAYMGQLFAYITPHVEVAMMLVSMLNNVFLSLMGFAPPGSSIPKGFLWLNRITPHSYALSIIVTTLLGNCPDGGSSDNIGCRIIQDTPPEIPQMTVKKYIETIYGMKHEDIGTNIICLIGIIMFFRFVALLGLRYINHQKR